MEPSARRRLLPLLALVRIGLWRCGPGIASRSGVGTKLRVATRPGIEIGSGTGTRSVVGTKCWISGGPGTGPKHGIVDGLYLAMLRGEPAGDGPAPHRVDIWSGVGGESTHRIGFGIGSGFTSRSECTALRGPRCSSTPNDLLQGDGPAGRTTRIPLARGALRAPVRSRRHVLRTGRVLAGEVVGRAQLGRRPCRVVGITGCHARRCRRCRRCPYHPRRHPFEASRLGLGHLLTLPLAPCRYASLRRTLGGSEGPRVGPFSCLGPDRCGRGTWGNGATRRRGTRSRCTLLLPSAGQCFPIPSGWILLRRSQSVTR